LKGKVFLHPIGLGSGIDIQGNVKIIMLFKNLRNLSRLGYAFLESGIVSDQNEISTKYIEYAGDVYSPITIVRFISNSQRGEIRI
jgi:hypothetical protein